MRRIAGRGDLLDHEPPTGASCAASCTWPPLALAATFGPAAPEPLTVRLPQPAPPDLAARSIGDVESDLRSMQINQPTMLAIRDLLVIVGMVSDSNGYPGGPCSVCPRRGRGQAVKGADRPNRSRNRRGETALDADPAEPSHGPTMDEEGRGTSPPATNSRSPDRLTEGPPTILPAPFSSQSAENRIPACSHDAFTHGMFRDRAWRQTYWRPVDQMPGVTDTVAKMLDELGHFACGGQPAAGRSRCRPPDVARLWHGQTAPPPLSPPVPLLTRTFFKSERRESNPRSQLGKLMFCL